MQEIINAIRAAVERARSTSERTVIRLPAPSREVEEILQHRGATLVRQGYDLWCGSDTCAHNSHDAGQRWSEYEVPTTWTPAPAAPDLFDYDENDNPVLALPAPTPVLIVCHKPRHYAATTDVATLRKHVMKVVQLTYN